MAGLRVLYVPHFSSPKMVRTCSTWNWAKVFFRRWVDTRPDVFVYFPVPRGQENDPDMARIDHPRIEKIPITVDDVQYLEAMALQPEFDAFSGYSGNKPVDVIFCDKICKLGALRANLMPFLGKACAPTAIVTSGQFLFDSQLSGMISLLDSWEKEQAIGWTMSDLNIFRTEGEYGRAEKICRRYLSPKMILDLMDSKVVGGIGNDLSRLDKFYKKDKPTKPITMNWAYGMTIAYHTKEVFATIDTLFRSGRDIRVLVTSSSRGAGRSGLTALAGKKYFELNWGLPQEKYYEAISGAHLFMFFPTRTRSLSYSVIEQMYLGLVGIFPRGLLKPEMIPDDYPFLFSNTIEALAHLRWIVDNWADPKVQNTIERMREIVREKYNGISDAERIIEKIEDVYEVKDKEVKVRRACREIVEELFAGKDQVSWEEVITAIHARNRIVIRGAGSADYLSHTGFSMAVFRRAMRAIGMPDSCESSTPVFVRRASEEVPVEDAEVEEEEKTEVV